MNTARVRAAAAAALLTAGAFLLYSYRLADAPMYLSHDEVLFALHAHAVATTGHDANGRFLPMYFQITTDYWAQPLVIYATALVLRVLPLSETAVRLPSALIGSLDVLLMYLLAKRLFRSTRIAIAAGALLALTPAHVIHSRMGVDPIYPLAFVLAWLLCMARAAEAPTPSRLVLAALLLGAGVFSYIGAVVMMPVFFVLTIIAVSRIARDRAVVYAAAAVGFLVPLSAFAAWLSTHPAFVSEQLRRYAVSGASFTFSGLAARLAAYGGYFNPVFLFITGGSSMTNSTGRVGVFLLPAAAFVVLGIYRMLREPSPLTLIIVGGFVLAPLAAAMAPGTYAVDRVLVMLPFAILIMTFGLRDAWSSPPMQRTAAMFLGVLLALQFATFYRDYLTDYRRRSAVWFGENRRGALEKIIELDRNNPGMSIYLSDRIPWIEAYWKFYVIKNRSEPLTARTIYFNPDRIDVGGIAENSIVLIDISRDDGLLPDRWRGLKQTAVITEPTGDRSFAILER